MSLALLCLAAGAYSAAVEAPRFTISWEHSIEHVEWRETWAVQNAALVPIEARIKGTGAGMEPPPDARREGGWYVYVPHLSPQTRISYPDSGFAKPLQLCVGDAPCRPIRSFLPPETPADAVIDVFPAVDGRCPVTPRQAP